MVQFALTFSPAAYFALMVLAFTTVTAVLGSSLARGLASLFFGLALGLVGIDTQSGQARFTLGIPELLDGIDVIVVVVGLFAVGEALYVASRYRYEPEEITAIKGSIWMSREDWARSWKPWLRGTGLGFPFGTLPAGGAEIPTFLSYMVEKRLAKRPEEFGHGAIEGVAGPEAANNAAAAGVLVPLLALGLPTSATAAILLAAFQQFGLQPGPLLFATQPDLVWGLIASLYVGNVMLLLLNLPLVGLVGEGADDPAAAALCRHPGVRDARRLHAEQQRRRPDPALPDRRDRLRHARAGRAGRALRDRPDPRPARRSAVPSRAVDQPGRLDGVLHRSALGRVPADRPARRARAVRLALVGAAAGGQPRVT